MIQVTDVFLCKVNLGIMGLAISNCNQRLIPLSVIQLSSGHCICQLLRNPDIAAIISECKNKAENMACVVFYVAFYILMDGPIDGYLTTFAAWKDIFLIRKRFFSLSVLKLFKQTFFYQLFIKVCKYLRNVIL